MGSHVQTGIILGPALLGRTDLIKRVMYHTNNPRMADIISRFGLTLFMFVTGVKMDVNMVFKTGKKAWSLGLTSYLVSAVIGVALVESLRCYFLVGGEAWQWSLFLGTIQSFTPFPVISQLLEELEIMNSELGRLGLSSALISDSLNTSIFIFWRFLGSYVTNTDEGAFIDSAIFILLVFAIVFLLRPAMNWVVSQTPENKPVAKKYITSIFILIFLCASLSHHYNRTPVLGAYILGLAIPPGPPLGSALVSSIETFTVGVLLPITATTTVMKAEFGDVIFGAKNITYFTIILITVVFLSKFTICLMIPLRCKIPFKDAITLALIMNCNGIIQMTCCTIPGVYEVHVNQAPINQSFV